MTSLLVYSKKSQYCVDLLEFIEANELLTTVVKFHDVNAQGVPTGISRVPSLITHDGKVIIGGDIKTFLEGFIIGDIEPVTLSSAKTFDLDGSDVSGNWFDIEKFGVSLQPKMTKELEEKISLSVEDALQSLKR